MEKIKLYNNAKKRLEEAAEKCGITIQKYYVSESKKLTTDKSKIFELFCGLNADRQYMGNTIQYYTKNRDYIKKITYDYDYKKVFNTPKEEFIKQGLTNNDSSDYTVETWKKYLSALHECAEYLDGQTINSNKLEFAIEDYFVEPKSVDEYKLYLYNLRALQSMTYVGVAVVTNWLKECGVSWLSKPDEHIKNIVAALMKKYKFESDKSIPGHGRCKLTNDEYVVLYMYLWAKDLDVDPFLLDRVIYMYCAREKFYLDKGKYPRHLVKDITEQDLIDKINSED